MTRAIFGVACILAISGCATTPPVIIEKPVVVEVEKVIAIPPDFLTGCAGKPPRLGLDPMPVDESSAITNGDLLMSYTGLWTYTHCLESRIQSIRDIQP